MIQVNVSLGKSGEGRIFGRTIEAICLNIPIGVISNTTKQSLQAHTYQNDQRQRKKEKQALNVEGKHIRNVVFVGIIFESSTIRKHCV